MDSTENIAVMVVKLKWGSIRKSLVVLLMLEQIPVEIMRVVREFLI